MSNLLRAIVPLAALVVLAGASCACAQDATEKPAAAKDKKIIVPKSSEAKPEDKGKRAHTNYLIGNGGKPITPPKPVGDAPPRN